MYVYIRIKRKLYASKYILYILQNIIIFDIFIMWEHCPIGKPKNKNTKIHTISHIKGYDHAHMNYTWWNIVLWVNYAITYYMLFV